MSWLDDVPVSNDDQNQYDPNHPIEREFVLAPAWRAFKANLSAIFKRSNAEQEEQYSTGSQPPPLTSRISEPEPPASISELEASTMQPVDAPELSVAAEDHELPPVANYEPVIKDVLSPRPQPAIAAPFESEPVLEQEEQQEVEPAAWESVAEPIAEPELEPIRYEEPSRLHLQPEIQTEMNEKAIAAAASASQRVESQSMQSAAHATSATVLADARGQSKLVAAAVAIESWVGSVKDHFASWKASLKQKRASAQRELFVVPGSTSKRSERDRVWMQTTVAAAAIALAFLMGWIAANSRRPAWSTDQATAPVESQPTSTARGATLAPATPKTAGVTVQAGGATVQAGGVTLLPTSNVSAAIPPERSAEAVSSKPSPARAARSSRVTSRGHLRRSIDPAPTDDEVVVHHYAPKPSPIIAAQKQTAQVKQYSDIN